VVDTTALQYPAAYILPKIEKKKKLTSIQTEFDEEDALNVESIEQNLDENGEFATYEDELA
jgi:hypothetical protein